MITSDIKYLRTISDPVTVDEVDDIINKLEKELSRCHNGIGLSAIQIGIPKRVSVIKQGDEFIHLINAKITEKDDPMVFVGEGCLSMPGIYVDTQRYRQISISTDVVRDGKFDNEEWAFYFEDNILIPIAVQHEIDHFDGILIQDREWVQEAIKNSTKVGRNDKCPCGKLKPDGSPLKYKKCCGRTG